MYLVDHKFKVRPIAMFRCEYKISKQINLMRVVLLLPVPDDEIEYGVLKT